MIVTGHRAVCQIRPCQITCSARFQQSANSIAVSQVIHDLIGHAKPHAIPRSRILLTAGGVSGHGPKDTGSFHQRPGLASVDMEQGIQLC